MNKLIIHPNNKKYYSEDFIKGFECGVTRQYNLDKEKINKAIEEIIKYRNDEDNDFCEVEVGAINGVLEILKRNLEK